MELNKQELVDLSEKSKKVYCENFEKSNPKFVEELKDAMIKSAEKGYKSVSFSMKDYPDSKFQYTHEKSCFERYLQNLGFITHRECVSGQLHRTMLDSGLGYSQRAVYDTIVVSWTE
jgi:hypothetical protein